MRNIIITNISALPPKEPQINSYTSDIGEFTGKYTNEAPIKYLMSYLNKKGEKADIIIAVRTAEANSAYFLFEEVVRAYAEEISSPEPEIIPIDTSETELEKTIDAIISLVNENDKVLIDTTGGFRNSSYLLMAVVRFLEYAGIGLTKAIYAKFHDERKIIDITDTYRMFDLINAVNTFSIMGNSRELESYFTDQDNEVVKQTIAAMNSFSDEISLCRTSKLDTVLKTLNDRLNELSELHTDSKDVILLKSLSGIIKNKFGCNNDKIEYPDVVKWCLDNKMIQQAITIYVEKMPEYFYKKQYFTVTDDILESVKIKNETSHNDFYYELFYSSFLVDLIAANDRISIIFAEIAKFIKDKSKLMLALTKLRNEKLNILITGGTGCGKSSTINAMFGEEVAKVGIGVDPETMEIEKYSLGNMILWDSPGLGDGKEADNRHAKNIIKKLAEKDENGNALIDLVLVILDGSSRDLGTSYELINNVIIPNLGKNREGRILVAINQADLAMKGRNWDMESNRPNAELTTFLDAKVDSVKKRIVDLTVSPRLIPKLRTERI